MYKQEYMYNYNPILTFSRKEQYIVDQHWPETCEFIKRTVELWNRWIRLSWYYNRV